MDRIQALEHDLAAATEAADAAERTKDALLSHVSHELRTPLNAIIGFAELSLQQIHGRMDGRYLGYLTDIRSAAAQLLHVVNNLLESAAEESPASPGGTAVHLAGIVSQAKAHVAHLAASRGIDLTSVAVSEDCVVHGDAQRLHRILRQLLSNAIKFTRSPGRIGVEVARPDGGSVEIAVWDTGIGIPPDLQTRIFESFAQLSTDVMSRPCDGLGLGLALARRLARQMGGDIRVESAAGLGSRFIVTLPLIQAEQRRAV